MAVVFLDGFDHYNSYSQKWPSLYGSSPTGPTTTNARGGYGKAMYLHSSAACGIYRSFTAQSTMYIGFALYANSWGNTNLIWTRSGGTSTWALGISGTTLLFMRGNLFNGATTLSSMTNPMVTGTYYYLEIKSINDTSSGTLELKINGVVQTPLAFTGNTGSTSVDILGLGFQSGNSYGASPYYYDDMYWDNSTYRGDCRVETLYPDSAGNSTDWTVSGAASNWDAVNDAGTPSENEYVETSTATNKDLYNLGSLVTTSGSVYAVQTNVFARKTDAGSRTMHSVLRHSTNESSGSSISLADSNLYYRDVFSNVPGGTGWTISQVNALEAGFELDT